MPYSFDPRSLLTALTLALFVGHAVSAQDGNKRSVQRKHGAVAKVAAEEPATSERKSPAATSPRDTAGGLPADKTPPKPKPYAQDAGMESGI